MGGTGSGSYKAFLNVLAAEPELALDVLSLQAPHPVPLHFIV